MNRCTSDRDRCRTRMSRNYLSTSYFGIALMVPGQP